MKKRLIGILLCLCMVLMLCPVTALAEGETLTPVTEIDVEIDAPVVGKQLQYSWSHSATPTSVTGTKVFWSRILKTNYTGGESDVWEPVVGNPPCSEDYYYMLVCTVKIYDRYKSSYTIPETIDATINGESCDVSVAEDGKSCTMTYMFEAMTIKPVESVSITVDEPVIGETPDQSFVVTGSPKGSVGEQPYSYWSKLPADQDPYDPTKFWSEVGEDEVFTEGYYYLAVAAIQPESGFDFDQNTSFTGNGKEVDPYFVDPFDNSFYVGVLFGPLEPQYTVTVPFTTTVKLGGSDAPGKTVFTLEVFESSAGEIDELDVDITASVTTNGAGSYDGEMTITGPFEQVRVLLSEGALVRQVNDGKANWTYDDTVWGLILEDDTIAELSLEDEYVPEYTLKIYPTEAEEGENGEKYYYLDENAGEVEKMSFTNIYTKSTSGQTLPTVPVQPGRENPNTGDNSIVVLGGLLLLAVGAAVVTKAAGKKRK